MFRQTKKPAAVTKVVAIYDIKVFGEKTQLPTAGHATLCVSLNLGELAHVVSIIINVTTYHTTLKYAKRPQQMPYANQTTTGIPPRV